MPLTVPQTMDTDTSARKLSAASAPSHGPSLDQCYSCSQPIVSGESGDSNLRPALINCSCHGLISLCLGCCKSSVALQRNTYQVGLKCPRCKSVSLFSEADVLSAKAEEDTLIAKALTSYASDVPSSRKPIRMLINRLVSLDCGLGEVT